MEAVFAEERREQRRILETILEAQAPSQQRKETAKLTKLTESEDIEAYLTTFERMMSAHEVDKEKWAFKLAPNLSGKAQLAYAAMDSDDAKDLRASQGDDFATLQHQYRGVLTTLSDHQKARRLVIQGPNCETAGPFAEMD